jgi:rhamnose utilization protein RhaD (predicted bifunctional aldolase and dehydrogenase)
VTDAEAQRQGALVLEAAAKIVTGSLECGMLMDQRTMQAAAITAEFLHQHARYVANARNGVGPFKLEVPA